MLFRSGEESNFEMTDEDGIFSFSFAKSGDDEVYINPENGFMRNVNAGMQYSNKWKEAHSLNLSPKYNEQDYYNTKNSKTITQLGDSALIENSEVNTVVKRYNYKNSLIYDAKIDTSNSLKLTLRFNYFHTDSREITDASTTGNTGSLKN